MMEGSTHVVKDPFKAVQNDSVALLKVLMLNGINTQIQDKDESALLHRAANYDQLEIIKFLLKKGADLTQLNKVGETVLHVVASKNYLHIAKLIFENINHDELRKFVDAKTTTGTTALHIASKNGFYDMITLLLSHGATYNVKNKKGKRPIDVTKYQSIGELLKRLKINFEQARAGQDKLYESLEKCSNDEFLAFVNARNNDGHNVMQVAVANCRENLVTLLQCLKVMLFRRRGHRAAFEHNYFDELLLLATNASRKLLDNDCTLETCLKSVRQFVNTFRSFEKRILDPNILSIEDMLSLLSSHCNAMSFKVYAKRVIKVHLKLFSASIYSVKLVDSTRGKDWALAEKCLAEMAFVNCSDEGGWTPLLHAVNAGNERIVKTLIDHGARVNCSTKIGKNTTLHLAANNGHFEIVQLLLERENSSEYLNAKTGAKGSTALHIAAKTGRFDIVVWLLKCRATYCVKNKDGQMPMDLVNDESHRAYLKSIGEAFDDAKNGKVEVIDKLENWSDDQFLAAVLCQNEEGHLLKDVALENKHDELANKIADKLKVILSEKGFRFKER
ncbi:poly [ADP-ribose] polymerase tankyrase-like [Phymastichus coffea]|uniref:poly [ADP-ribose] polymerase tankyrase-like n=1 Tax=Phymastichus coffea TaxID=108790 RepID=UPI00273AB9F9|nr:poly [ADP-ribose] polymerase tankyrase-like [Phymastichus coffea]